MRLAAPWSRLGRPVQGGVSLGALSRLGALARATKGLSQLLMDSQLCAMACAVGFQSVQPGLEGAGGALTIALERLDGPGWRYQEYQTKRQHEHDAFVVSSPRCDGRWR